MHARAAARPRPVRDVVEQDGELVAAERARAVSVARRTPPQPLGHRDQEASPASWPEVSLTSLKAIEVEEEDGEARPAAARGGPAPAPADREEGAVGQAGQRVVRRLVANRPSLARSAVSTRTRSSAPPQ